MHEDDDVIITEEGEESDAAKPEAKLGKLREDLATARREKQEYMDGWQRAKADYVNALKRFDEERAAASDRGVEKAVSALLPALDALERAKAHGELPQGFEAIARQLETAFSELGVVAFGSVGEPFDPMRHEALGTDTEGKEGHVSAVLERGYERGGQVLRPAKVRVFAQP